MCAQKTATSALAEEARTEKLRRRAARQHLLAFMHYCWWNPWPLIEGKHTREICDRLTKAVWDWMNGTSTFLVVQVPFRHGKSDIVSRALPAFFLGVAQHQQPDVITTGYGAKLVESFSRKCRGIIDTPAYRRVFPGVRLSSQKNAADKWAVEGSVGEVTAVGLGGSLTGHGGALIVLDDYCKTRQEAESPAYRQHTWEAFKDDLMTRRAPVSLVIVCATRWHTHDVVGQIQEHSRKDPDFPQFETLSFPARKEGEYEYLFPERFSEEWYRSQRAMLGKYSAAALLDLDPVVRGGNMFRVDNVHFVMPDEVPDGLLQGRAWDLASTQKERDKDDPDFTCGIKGGVTYEEGMPVLWITDCVALQEEAPKRNKSILEATKRDGPGVRVLVESVAGYKDTYTTLADILKGQRVVVKVNVSGEKVVRAAPLEPLFEAGNVRMVRGPWNDLVINQITAFPGADEHDDAVDAMAILYEHLREKDEIWGMNP